MIPTGHLLAFAATAFELDAVPADTRRIVRSPRRLEALGGGGGLIMIGLGVRLALTGRRD